MQCSFLKKFPYCVGELSVFCTKITLFFFWWNSIYQKDIDNDYKARTEPQVTRTQVNK